MKNLTPFRDTGSLIAGLLIGVAIVVPVFAMTIADLGNSEKVWVTVAPILVLAAGVVLQAAVTRPRQRRTNDQRLLAVSRLAMTALGSSKHQRSRHLTRTTLAPRRSDERPGKLVNTSSRPRTAILKCPSCGTLLAVSPDMERFGCKHCAAELIIARQAHAPALKRVA